MIHFSLQLVYWILCCSFYISFCFQSLVRLKHFRNLLDILPLLLPPLPVQIHKNKYATLPLQSITAIPAKWSCVTHLVSLSLYSNHLNISRHVSKQQSFSFPTKIQLGRFNYTLTSSLLCIAKTKFLKTLSRLYTRPETIFWGYFGRVLVIFKNNWIEAFFFFSSVWESCNDAPKPAPNWSCTRLCFSVHRIGKSRNIKKCFKSERKPSNTYFKHF